MFGCPHCFVRACCLPDTLHNLAGGTVASGLVAGRLVVFVPNMDGDDIAEVMPNENALKDAGLKFVNMVEQPLNDSLSRWLVEYKCIA